MEAFWIVYAGCTAIYLIGLVCATGPIADYGTKEEKRNLARMWLTFPFYPVWLVVGAVLGLRALWRIADWNPKK